MFQAALKTLAEVLEHEDEECGLSIDLSRPTKSFGRDGGSRKQNSRWSEGRSGDFSGNNSAGERFEDAICFLYVFFRFLILVANVCLCFLLRLCFQFLLRLFVCLCVFVCMLLCFQFSLRLVLCVCVIFCCDCVFSFGWVCVFVCMSVWLCLK